MKNKSLNKNEIKESLQDQIQARYNRNAIYFQYTHNASHPDSRIWRHMLCARTFTFFRSGDIVTVTVKIVRFIYAGTHRTFTFYAGLFLPFSQYPVEFVRSAISRLGAEQAFCVSLDTIRRWKKIFLLQDSHETTSLPLEMVGNGCYNHT